MLFKILNVMAFGAGPAIRKGFGFVVHEDSKLKKVSKFYYRHKGFIYYTWGFVVGAVAMKIWVDSQEEQAL